MSQPFQFGAWLKRERLAAGLTQADLARALDVARATISMMESNLKPPPGPRKAAALGVALGQSTDTIDKILTYARAARREDKCRALHDEAAIDKFKAWQALHGTPAAALLAIPVLSV